MPYREVSEKFENYKQHGRFNDFEILETDEEDN